MDVTLELITLFLNVGVLSLLISMRRKLDKRLVKPPLLTSFGCYAFASLATVLEHHFFPQVMNVLEHASCALSALFFLAWCHQILVMSTEVSEP